jgi:hypothetical protein
MTVLRFLNPQGIAGIAVSLMLGILLLVQKGETSHWRSESGRFEQLYAQEQSSLAGTVANYRAAADAARAADQANVERVTAEQRSINERTEHDYETRLAAARAAAERLRIQSAAAAADPGARGTTPVPGVADASDKPDEAAGQDRLPQSDALLATEQAIQLNELIKWVRRQNEVERSGKTAVESGSANR